MLAVDIDTFETYFDSHVDLLQRKLQKHSDRLKMKAEERFKIKDLSGDLIPENLEKEMKNIKLKVRLSLQRASRLLGSSANLRDHHPTFSSQPASPRSCRHGNRHRSFGLARKYHFSSAS